MCNEFDDAESPPHLLRPRKPQKESAGAATKFCAAAGGNPALQFYRGALKTLALQGERGGGAEKYRAPSAAEPGRGGKRRRQERRELLWQERLPLMGKGKHGLSGSNRRLRFPRPAVRRPWAVHLPAARRPGRPSPPRAGDCVQAQCKTARQLPSAEAVGRLIVCGTPGAAAVKGAKGNRINGRPHTGRGEKLPESAEKVCRARPTWDGRSRGFSGPVHSGLASSRIQGAGDAGTVLRGRRRGGRNPPRRKAQRPCARKRGETLTSRTRSRGSRG